ncbi:LOW QUALITY PROTEIN: protein deltex [Ostrinia nubilalis]|uniref:LOW QUALITY PROTEIN: protein deltex n=1 Tax=Ostrinia nubilalis TaxID=29057 RepID=UPI00308224D9
MSSVHCVVVWEWQSGGQWLPHTPAVTRTLERAHAKKLTRVVLADADPALRGHYVNLRTLTQCLDTPEGGSAECLVRRSCYGVGSPAGRGVRWEWARFTAAPHAAELNYEPLPMEMQCVVEEAWCGGAESVAAGGWALSVARMTARAGGHVRLLRRAPQPPYPLTRQAPQEPGESTVTWRMTARAGGHVRLLRRAPQPPYPLTRQAPQEPGESTVTWRMTARAGGHVRLLRRAPQPPYPLTRQAPQEPSESTVTWRMTARAGGHVRLLRRAPQPPYPLTRQAPQEPGESTVTWRMTARAGGHVRLLRRAPQPPYPLTRQAPQEPGESTVTWRMTARAGGHVRLLRRAPQPPYPLTRQAPQEPGESTVTWRMTARAGGHVRLLRRAPQPPYPLTRQAPQEPARRPRIPQQHTGSSVQSVQSAQSAQSMPAAPAPPPAPAPRRAGARSASPRDRKPGLARQILHNLNIFSNSNKPPAAPVEHKAPRDSAAEQKQCGEPECGSTRSGRRHSVDTVSTYLSHESKDSLQQGSVGELLNCSAGSDDVFDAPRAPEPPPTSDGTIVGSDSAAASVCGWVRAEACPQWGALCPACLRALRGPAPAVALTRCQHMLHLHCLNTQLERLRAAGVSLIKCFMNVVRAGPQWGALCPACLRALRGPAPAVALTRCQHMLHLHCLNTQLERLRAAGEALYIECLVCGRVYGRSEGAGAGAGAGGEGGAQPAGSMAWSLQPTPLPPYPHCSSILITYSFQSGRQGPRHPAPGAPYYAVGFPRHTLLPDTPLGRQVTDIHL